MAEEKWLYRSRQTKTMGTIRTAIYTYPEQIFHQPRPWVIDRGGKLATRSDDAFRCGGDNRIVLQLFTKILVRHVLVSTIVRFVQRGKLQIAALLRPLTIDVFDVVNGDADDGVQSTEGGEGHGGNRESIAWRQRPSWMDLWAPTHEMEGGACRRVLGRNLVGERSEFSNSE